MTDKDKPVTDKPAKKPKAEEPKAEEPKAEEPKAEEPKAEEPDSGAAAPTDDAATPAGTDQHGRQLYEVKCADCGKQTQVPFKPTGDRPVYCRDCYMKKRGEGTGGGMGKRPRR
jgi:CxxC-x17-CxxC domain-containing protein